MMSTWRARRRAVVWLLLTAAVSACVRHPPADPAALGRGGDILVVRATDAPASVRRLPLETYVRGAILGEVPIGRLPAPAARVMAEVQAIVARTYAVRHRGRHAADGYDLCATTHCQVYRDPDGHAPAVATLVDDAVARTRGTILVYEGEPALALYHADCGGATSSATSVWGGPAPPYLGGVPDRFCLVDRPRSWRVVVDGATLGAALAAERGPRVEGRVEQLRVTGRDRAGRVLEVAVDGGRTVTVRGEALRAAINRHLGVTSFASTRFEVRRDGDRFVFEGTGSGHGAGLCQEGAMARARAGHPAARILDAYYPGTVLGRLAASRS